MLQTVPEQDGETSRSYLFISSPSSFIGRSEDGSCHCSAVETEEHNNLPVFICRHHCFSTHALNVLFCFHPHSGPGGLDLPARSMGFVIPTGCPRYVLPTGHFNQMAEHRANTALSIRPPQSGEVFVMIFFGHQPQHKTKMSVGM